MSIVMDFYSGATRIIIRDDHCCAKEDVPQILEKIGHHVYEELYVKKSKQNSETA
jgi:hypothetical protein